MSLFLIIIFFGMNLISSITFGGNTSSKVQVEYVHFHGKGCNFKNGDILGEFEASSLPEFQILLNPKVGVDDYFMDLDYSQDQLGDGSYAYSDCHMKIGLKGVEPFKLQIAKFDTNYFITKDAKEELFQVHAHISSFTKDRLSASILEKILFKEYQNNKLVFLPISFDKVFTTACKKEVELNFRFSLDSITPGPILSKPIIKFKPKYILGYYNKCSQ